ncbi:glycine/betaine ABC transporter substrate-binding protein [Pseudoalteromonas sp. NBT06-2]|uniref:ABC transporter substrate-binding protein n=1 Tax=Pseudoalteromonas sp. NBT06-2 TaxID=2025950 RepID=UPI000BA66EB1|nr:ABC transporter substrate-binding protein [Pseudoalteromonas sp. NBT06-2]PAJ72575.1 glycine/betaine ABC transporter substrate-binding protein [Pseudoalteromonas sp. NBT06-2]
MINKRTSFLISSFLFCSLCNAQTIKNQQPISIIVNDWSSQIVLAHITGYILNSVGYKTKYSFSTINEQWGSLSQGIDHVQVEVWEGTMSTMFERVITSGNVIDAGSHKATTREEWWYPSYMDELCPDLPDWRALNKCSALFSNDDSNIGRYVAGPWEKPEAARIRALDLNFKIDTVNKADDLWSELKHAITHNKPIVLFNWTPNWVEAVYEGKFVEFPEYHIDCEIDPKWGINPNFHYDCGNPKNGFLKKAVWAGLKDGWPCAFNIIKNISFDNQIISDLAAAVDFKRLSYEQAAKQWLNENEHIWHRWIPTTCEVGNMP